MRCCIQHIYRCPDTPRLIAAGFRMWDQSKSREAPNYVQETEADVIQYLGQQLGGWFELGVDQLPEGCEDIRGLIFNEKGRIFAARNGGSFIYFGVWFPTENDGFIGVPRVL